MDLKEFSTLKRGDVIQRKVGKAEKMQILDYDREDGWFVSMRVKKSDGRLGIKDYLYKQGCHEWDIVDRNLPVGTICDTTGS